MVQRRGSRSGGSVRVLRPAPTRRGGGRRATNRRRRLTLSRLLALAVVLGVVLASAVLLRPTSVAGPDGPSNFRSIARTPTSITLAWKGVDGADGYRVSYGPSSYVVGSVTKTTLSDLDPTTTYRITISAVKRTGRPAQDSSTIRVATADVTKPSDVKVDATSSTSADVTWDAVKDASSYRVYWGTEADGTDRTKIDSDSAKVALPELRRGTTYYVRVAAIVDGVASAYTDDTTWTTSNAVDIDVASYNVFANRTAPRDQTWAKRRGAVRAMIASRTPDVIGLQEASQNPLNGQTSSTYRYFDDVIAGAGPYKLTNRAAYNCARPNSPGGSRRCSGGQVVQQGASAGTRIAYNTKTMTLKSSGAMLLSNFSETQSKSYNDRYMAWAVLKPVDGGPSIFFVSTHLDPKSVGKRVGERARLLSGIGQLNSGDLPVVLVGDFNTFPYEAGPYNQVIAPIKAAGFTDPLGTQAGTTRRADVPGLAKKFAGHSNCDSITHFRRHLSLGSDCWGPGYGQNAYNGNNIDYIFVKGVKQVKEWETVMNLDASGNLVGVIPSDHHMIRAVVTVE